MAIKFITGNKAKIFEARAIIPDLDQLNIDLVEIQELDAHKIIKYKIKEAFKHSKGSFIVEDSSMYMDCLGGKLPGPLIKWFNDTIGTAGTYQIANKFKNYTAKAVTVIGYAENSNKIKFFEGSVKGTIVKPKGKYLFGYDPIFMPKGSKLTLSELKAKGDFSSSPRGIAFKKLLKYLRYERK